MFEEIELTTILRIAPSLVPRFNEHIRKGDPTSIKIFPTTGIDNGRVCSLTVGPSVYQGILLDLPRHIESYKTLDTEQYFKTNDIGQILIIFEDISEMDAYNGISYYPHGLTKPLENAYATLKSSTESLTKVPAQDVSAIESIIYNQKTTSFTYSEIIEEEPHMRAYGNVHTTGGREKTREAHLYYVC